ncbi:MAG: glycosyltransferase family 2 protein [Solirubrobacteraceae bacterium]
MISVVFVTYESATSLPRAVASVRRWLAGAEIIVVDNGSTDGSVLIARDLGVDCVISGHGNVGFGEGVNRGVNVASNDLVLLLNPDCEIVGFHPEALERMEQASPLGLLGCNCVGRAGIRRNVYDVWSWRKELAWAFYKWFGEPRWLQLPRPRAICSHGLWVSGFALFVRRAEFLQVEGFDPEFFMYWEDYELAQRYTGAGFSVGATDAIRVLHEGGGSQANPYASVGLSILGLVEWVDRRCGAKEAQRAARAAVRGLRLVSQIASVIAQMPGCGGAFGRKAEGARIALLVLTDTTRAGSFAGKYRGARQAFAFVLPGT